MKRRIWIIADTHFNHYDLIPDCGRVENFEELIISGFKKLKDTDILIHLGDICLGKDQEVHDSIIKKFQFTKILVRGNHDGKSNNWYLNNGWNFVCEQFKDTYFGRQILFSHKPVKWEDDYDLNLHGHFHNISQKYHEKELVAIKNSYQILFALEYLDYQPILLEDFLRNNNLID